MSRYYYIKIKRRNIKPLLRLVGISSVLSGAILLTYFFFPIISYQLFIGRTFARSTIETPVPRYLVVGSGSFASLFSQGVSALTTDFTDARNWFPDIKGEIKNRKTELYTLSIPKLKIENATVSTNDYDLLRHLVQYFGTSTPPDKGTSVIFGHSTLPQLFDPKNYKTIFATLHTIGMGDEIILNVNGMIYTYKVFSIVITDPSDPNIFSQSYDNSYITLVTCTPPGTTWKRLIVRASLIK